MSLMTTRKTSEPKFKPGDLRSVKHAAQILEVDEQTVRKLANNNLNFTVVTLKDGESEKADPIYRIVWDEFERWLESRLTQAAEIKEKVVRHLPK
jgi:hypothetical protein